MQRMPKYGRSPDAVKILPGLSPIVASTEQEARRKEAELDELILPAVGVWMLSEQMQFRLYRLRPRCRDALRRDTDNRPGIYTTWWSA